MEISNLELSAGKDDSLIIFLNKLKGLKDIMVAHQHDIRELATMVLVIATDPEGNPWNDQFVIKDLELAKMLNNK